jgi:hypothetical protein
MKRTSLSWLWRCVCCCGAFCFLPNLTIAQQNNIWYFGHNAGLDFSSGAPLSITGGRVHTDEGSATMTDPKTGLLLFYTDGYNVFDRNHNKMPNGDSTLAGHFSSCQSATIIPKNCNQYYVVTSDQVGNFGPNRGINYSIVDMTLNGGLGDVTTLNAPLLKPATEKVAAVMDADSLGYWVIAHQWQTDSFYAWHVNDLGFSAPVVTGIGSVYTGRLVDNIGQLMISPDETKLAAGTETGLLELFDFDNRTGIVSNYVSLPGLQWTYGVCFSPDSRKLYAAAAEQKEVDQYDLSSGVGASVRLSRTPIYQGSATPEQFGFMQLGPDAKIYVARQLQPWLGVIESPNMLGKACNYVNNGISLGADSSDLGLPNYLYSYAPDRPTVVALAAPTVHGGPGDTVTIPITISVAPLTSATYSFDVSLNRTIFSPLDKSLPQHFVGDERIITISGTADSSTMIYNLKCVIGLGDSATASLSLEKGAWSASCPSSLSLSNGTFTLDGICPAGGDRLFNPLDTFALGQSMPNPTKGFTSIAFSTPEDTYTELILVDLLGTKVKNLLAQNVMHGSYFVNFDVSGLAAGVYYYVLRTTDKTMTNRLVISR